MPFPEGMQEEINRKPHLLAMMLISIVVISLGLRLLHVDFGLPDFLHVDEIGPIRSTQHMLQGNAEMLNYNHPPLLKNLAFAGLKIYLAFQAKSLASDQEVVLALRLFSVMSGVVTVIFLYLLALHFVDRRLALLAALLFAVLPLTVVTSKYGVPDMLLGSLFLVGLWLSVKLYERPTPILYGATGVVLVLAFGAKYPGCFLALPALLAHVMAHRRSVQAEQSVPAGKAALFFALGAFIGTCISFPLVFYDLPSIIKGFFAEVHHVMVAGHEGIKVSGRDMFFLYHFRYSVLPATGPILFAFIPAGLAIMALRRQPKDLLVMAIILPYYFTVEWAYLVLPSPDRYILPLVGPYLLAATIALQRLVNLVPSKRLLLPVAIALTGILSIWPIYKTATILHHMVPDTRQVMQEWMEKSLDKNTIIFIERHTPTYYAGQNGLSFPFVFYSPDISSFTLLDYRGGYFLTSSFTYDRYLRHPDQRPDATFFYKTLFSRGILLHEVSSPGRQYLFHNPTLRLYRIP